MLKSEAATCFRLTSKRELSKMGAALGLAKPPTTSGVGYGGCGSGAKVELVRWSRALAY
jgi:hypothetical protein